MHDGEGELAAIGDRFQFLFNRQPGISISTVFPRIVRARSINFTSQMLRGQFEGALYSRARFNPTDCISARIRISFTSACRSR